MKQTRLVYILSLTAAVFAAAGCSWMPKVKVPFTSGTPVAEDPQVSFDVRRPLTSGHTLKIAVYRNLISPTKAFAGSVMVDQKGNLQFKNAGVVHVGGRSAYDAIKAIEAAFSREYGDSTVTVQLFSIEDVSLVTVTGAVRSPGVIQWFDNMNADSALPYVGDRIKQGDARAIHVTRDGVRRFYAHSGGVELKAGDLVKFSSDI
ncbi:MAG: polysaccharide biosynthesis/export family protein [Verrucomicrobia bacterium]|nr:polysaccharide biosynthesis/export family protein [Verrucomicrobiota bacterium]